MATIASAALDLFEAARAADPGVSGAAVLDAARPSEPGWHVVTRADGVRVRIDTATGAAPTAAALAAAVDLDLSPAALLARDDLRHPARKALRDLADQAVADIDTFLAIADTATAAQVRQATKRLAQMMKAVILRLTQIE